MVTATLPAHSVTRSVAGGCVALPARRTSSSDVGGRAGARGAPAYSAVVPTSQRVGTKAGLYKHTTRVAWQAASLPRQKRGPSQPWPTLGQAKQMWQSHATSSSQTKAVFE